MPCPECGVFSKDEHCTSNTCTWFVCKGCKVIFSVDGRAMEDRQIA